jgi:nicotinate-nucleotide adenylyltransferase
MKIGLYFGSFNPIHHGHLIIANYILQKTNIDQVWFVISPQNPLKQSIGLLNEYHRLFLVQTAIEGEINLKASDIEFKLAKPNYTVDTLAHLQERYTDHEFAIIMGGDSFQNLANWKNYKHILKYYPVYVYTRSGYKVEKGMFEGMIIILKAPLLEISATHIRDNIKTGKSIRYLVPEKVREEIEKNSYYKHRENKKEES